MEINKFIDHTLLDREISSIQIKKLCAEALEYNFKSVCISPEWVSLASSLLQKTDILICTVIGFPFGTSSTEEKISEVRKALTEGVDEFDVVLNQEYFKKGDHQYVLDEIKAIIDIVNGKTVKIILETCLLNKQEIIESCNLSLEAGATFVKTSTGFSKYGARKEDIVIMKKTINRRGEIKASGGIKSFHDAKKFIDLGATRIGTSSGVKIIEEEKNNLKN